MHGPGSYLIGQEEIAEVLDVLKSGQLSRYRSGEPGKAGAPKVYQFEREFEAFTGARHCLAVNSGTSALMTSLASLGIGPGDEVIVPGYTFVATMSAVAYSGAVPVLAEIDESLTLDPKDVARKVTPRTKAIIAVHMLGAPCDMDEIIGIAKEHNLRVIEDVCQACGGSYKGARLGTIGDVGVFSLNVYKTITAGDGGMLITNDTARYERAFAFHDQGAKPLRLGLVDEESLLGINLRMNELTGAVALAQLRKLDTILSTLRSKKRLFKEPLAKMTNIRFRTLHDQAGECATILTLVLETHESARAVAEAIGSKTLAHSGKHYYRNMLNLLNKNMPTTKGCPFACEAHPTDVTYSADMLPQTDDILDRTVCLSVGVTDPGLGTDFGINILTEEREIIGKADEFVRLNAHILSNCDLPPWTIPV